jgi:hypothetical protein
VGGFGTPLLLLLPAMAQQFSGMPVLPVPEP